MRGNVRRREENDVGIEKKEGKKRKREVADLNNLDDGRLSRAPRKCDAKMR